LAAGEAVFTIARNPQEDTKLPYLLRLPIEGGLVHKARDTWPRAARIYCHAFEEDWPEAAETLEEIPVASCRRRGVVIDLVLDRARLSRSQFVFTETRGRPAIFWQTQKAAKAANPGAGSRAHARSQRVSRSRSIPASATRTGSPAGVFRPNGLRFRPATTR
jgi:hypothetical protein